MEETNKELRFDRDVLVYVMGAYNGPNVIDILDNMREGINLCTDLAELGFNPYCPWLDFQYGLNRHLPVETYKRVSIAWMKKADICILTSNWKNSQGTKNEMALASLLGIPVMETKEELIEYSEAFFMSGHITPLRDPGNA